MVRAIGVAGLVALAVVAACGGYQKLKVDDVKAVAVTIDEPQERFCAYAPVELRARVTYKNGDTAQTQTPGEGRKGRLRPAEFEWVSAFGTIDDTAVLRLAPDPFAWLEKPIRVSAKVAARPEMFGATELAPRFDCGGTLDLKGKKGARGGELEDGGAGAPGPVVDVALSYVESPRRGRLVLVRVARDGAPPEHFVIDAANAQKPFVIDASGGDGGRGGQGIAGLYGTAGIPGVPGMSGQGCDAPTPGGPGSAGTPGGPGGAGKNGGAGGPGGRVTVRFDAHFPELADRIEVRVAGGAAGDAGPGGPGGFGGAGGAGGAGGKINLGCPGFDAAAGTKGADGAAGPIGPPGQPGIAGPNGTVQRVPADVATLFADEIGRGIAVATGGAP